MPIEGAAKVWRTRDAGESWEPLGNGLPQRDCYFSVLRDAFTSDSLDPAGLYFGTRGGQLFASRDEGESWQFDRGLAARGAVRKSGRGRVSIGDAFSICHLRSVDLPATMRSSRCGCQLDVRMTISDAFVMLGRDYPAIRQRVLDDQNNIRRHVNVFVNGENVRFMQGGLTQVSNDSEVWIYPALSGG